MCERPSHPTIAWCRGELPPEPGFARREAHRDTNAGPCREWPASWPL